MTRPLTTHPLAGLEAAPSSKMSICVFCGSQTGYSPEVAEAARRVGELIGSRGHRLIYGAGGTGLMGTVARAAVHNGGEVVGVIPRFLYERERGQDAPMQSVVMTKDLFDRKRRMIDFADAFLALPGGFGTLDEVCEVVSMTYLGLHSKPFVLLNIDNAWTQFTGLVTDLQRRGFASDDTPLLHLADAVEDAIGFIEARLPVNTRRLSPAAADAP